MSTGHVYTEEDIKYIKKHYKPGEIQACADYIGVSVDALRQYCYKHNISSGRFLTKNQLKYLENNINKSNQELAKRFKRNANSFRYSRYHHNFGTIIDSNYDKLHVCELARVVGKHHSTITKSWIGRHGLKSQKIGERYRFVEFSDLFEFMQEHPNFWKPSECEKWFFENEDWFQQAREEENRKIRQERWGKFYEVN